MVQHAVNTSLRPVRDGDPRTSDRGTGLKATGKETERTAERHPHTFDNSQKAQAAEGSKGNADDIEEEEDEELEVVEEVDPEQQKRLKITSQHSELFDEFWKLAKGKKIQALKTVFERPGGFEDFCNKYGSVFNAVGDKGETLLHLIAKKGAGSALAIWLLQTYPDLVLRKNEDGNTALYVAAETSKKTIVKAILEGSSYGFSTLARPGPNGNPLHKLLLQQAMPHIGVVHNALKAELSRNEPNDDLVKVKEMFRHQDKNGMTPLHVAITTMTRYNGSEEKDRKNLTDFVDLVLLHDPDVLNEFDNSGKTPLHHALNAIGKADYNKLLPNIEHLINWVLGVIERYPTAFLTYSKDKRPPYLFLGDTKGEEPCKALAEAMKRLYLRDSFDHKDLFYSKWNEDTNRSEFSSGAERRVYFDLSTMPDKTYKYEYFQGLAGQVKFESVLHHVDLPNFTVTGGEDLFSGESNKERFHDIQALTGRVDFLKIFEWLRVNGVKGIIDVRVADSVNTCHCDEAIEMALENFDIEKLEWQRDDICTDVFVSATPNVRELYLYSSGNNEVLRGWSGKEGLGTLKHLKKVDLAVRRGTISERKIAHIVRQFKENLQSHRPDVEVVDRTMESYVSAPQDMQRESTTTAENHPWLHHMDQFANAVKINDRHLKPQAPRVKVAIIDDGIDSANPSIRKNIVTGTSFHYKGGRSDRPVDYWTSPGGHGTEMAKMVCRICPTAELYSIRLGEGSGARGVRQIKIDTAIKAVEWATNAGVNIISMSWSINKNSVADSGLVDAFRQCIRGAHDKGIVMFCAASDIGNVPRSSDDYDIPAGFGGDVIRIGAATVQSEKSKATGEQPLDFYLPGEGISLGPGAPSDQLGCGSSLATAAAAGLAALIQYCMSAVALKDNSEHKQPLNIDDVKHAFRALSGNSGKNIPEVDSLFKDGSSLDRPQQMMARCREISQQLQRRR